MSFIMKHSPLTDIKRLFFPPVCAACGRRLTDRDDFLCNYCRWEIPLTGFWQKPENPVAAIFHGQLPVVNASAFYFFVSGSGFRDLIHDFKYRDNWLPARKMGEWYGAELAASPLYADVDLVIPVPLHLRKKIRRGYNQSEYIAEGISKATGIPLDVGSVRRSTYNISQTRRRKSERWQNVEGIFSVRRPDALRRKHLLLVDDVLTTGATMISFGETILKAVPDCRLSIAALAVSKSELDAVKKVY